MQTNAATLDRKRSAGRKAHPKIPQATSTIVKFPYLWRFSVWDLPNFVLSAA
jgi:hypothetical protein